MRIINETNLTYREIGTMIDKIISESKGHTIFYGLVEHGIMEWQDRKINVQIRYLKRYTEWRFWENDRNK